MPARGLIICAALALLQPAAANEDPGRALLDGFLNDVDSLSARFEQSLIDADAIVLETSRGTVQIQRPGQFRWSYEEPYVQLLVADGLNVWSYDVDLEQVTVKPQAEVLANTPALLLGGGRSVDDEFEYVQSFDDPNAPTVWVRLRPKNADNGFTQVELGFDDGVLRRMRFADTLLQTTEITLTNVELNTELDAAFFDFTVPAGTDLIGEPVVAERANP